MQVSWIDADEIRDLLKQLEGPKAPSTASAWETHTLPLAPIQPLDADQLLAPEGPPASHSDESKTPQGISDEHAGPANAELLRIRERLRVLRDKAHSAGIFARTQPTEPSVAPEPQATPVEVAAPEPALPAPAAEPSPALPETPAVAPARATIQALPAAFESPFALAEAPPPVEEPTTTPQAKEQIEEQEPVSPAVEPLFETTVSEPLPPANGGPGAEQAAPVPEAIPSADNPPPQPSHPPFAVPHMGLSDRLNAFAEWACSLLGTREVLLVDDYGDVLWGTPGQTALVLSAVMAWHSAQRASASATCIDPERIDKPLPPDRSLTVLPLRTRYGVVSLAVIQGQPVTAENATAIRQALAVAVEGHAGPNGQEGT